MAVDGSTPALDLEIDGLDDARRIGRGECATVFAARDVDSDRWVTVKILDGIDDVGRRRFDREIVTIDRLSDHPNIVSLHRTGYTDAGDPFIVTDLVEGESLLDLVRRGGAIDWEQAIDYLIPVADALAQAHDRGVHHREVTPATIIVADGLAKLSDFGIAAVYGRLLTNRVGSSLCYHPPEARIGADARDDGTDDGRSDLYSLAATLYALVAGRPPFLGDDDEPGAVRRRTETEAPRAIDGVPASLNDFFARALATSPADRPVGARAMAEELRAVRARSAAETARRTAAPAERGTSSNGAPSTAVAPNEAASNEVASNDAPSNRAASNAVASNAVASNAVAPNDAPSSGAASNAVAPDAAVSDAAVSQDTRPHGAAAGVMAPNYRRLAGGSIAMFALLAAGLFTMVRLSDTPVIDLSTPADGATSGASETTEQPLNPVVGTSRAETPGSTDRPAAAAAILPRVFTEDGAVWEVVGLADGRLAAAADSDVKVWDPTDFTSTSIAFVEHSNPVQAMIGLADGRIASSATDGTILLWDPEDPDEPVAVFRGHDAPIQDLAQLADGRVASGGLNETLQFWNPDDLDEITTVARPFSDVWSLVVLADGRLAAGTGDHLIRIMNPDEPDEPPLVLAGHESVAIDLAVLLDGRLASAALDSTVRLWDPAHPEQAPLVYRRHSSPVQAVVGLPDGRVASAGVGLTIHVWDPVTIDPEPLVLEGHVDAITSLAVLPDGRLVSASADGTVRVWDLGIGRAAGRTN